MLDLLTKGGVVLWTILLLALVATVIIIERFLYFKRIKTDEEKLFQRVKSALGKGHFDEAMAICDGTPSPFSSLLKISIEHREQPPYQRKEVLKDAAAQEVPFLEKNIGALGTIAHIAPLLGLLGTVTGNIEAFGVLGRFGAVNDPSILAKGISEALVTTAAGLIVAIPAVIFHNTLVERVNKLIVRMENQVNEMILLIGGIKEEGV